MHGFGLRGRWTHVGRPSGPTSGRESRASGKNSGLGGTETEDLSRVLVADLAHRPRPRHPDMAVRTACSFTARPPSYFPLADARETLEAVTMKYTCIVYRCHVLLPHYAARCVDACFLLRFLGLGLRAEHGTANTRCLAHHRDSPPRTSLARCSAVPLRNGDLALRSRRDSGGQKTNVRHDVVVQRQVGEVHVAVVSLDLSSSS